MRRREYKRQKGSPTFLLVGLAASIAAYIYLGHPAVAALSAVIFGLLVCWNQRIGVVGILIALVAGAVALSVTGPQYDLTYNSGILGGVVLCVVLAYGLKVMVFGTGSKGELS
jgi:hypothetical protein